MVRKLALAVSLALGSLPLSVHALGLGGVKTYSALNENLKADIELYSVKRGELDTLKVKLASAEVFAKMGVERPFLLSRLKFNTLRLKNGKAIIRVTSDVPIAEPFLDFFIEVHWPTGQMVKEYTILLDPPAFTRRSAPVVRNGSQARTRASVSTPSRQTAGSAAIQNGAYGPIAPNETLWDIAADLKPAGVTIHQMMMALFEANPSAFARNNINLLKQGQMLQIPEAAEIASIDRQQAVAQFREQTSEWRSSETLSGGQNAQQSTEAKPTRASSASETEKRPAGQLKIAGADETPSASAALGGTGGQSNKEQEQLRQRVMLLEEQAESARQEAADLRAQLEDLQRQLETNRRLLKLRDEELAKLQDALTLASEREVPAQITSPVAEDQTDGQTPVASSAESVADVPVSDEPSKPVAQAQSSDTKSMPGQTELAEEEGAEKSAMNQSSEDGKPASLTEDPMAWLQNNWKLAAGAGGGVALLLLLLALGSRKKRQDENQEQVAPESVLQEAESILTASSDSTMTENVDLVSDTSFLSEYSSEEFRAISEDTVDSDPIAEADLYIGDTLYSKAEQTLQQALLEGRGNQLAVKHKLLEVYFSTQKKKDFFGLVRDMLVSGLDKEDPEAWKHVQSMGRTLDPGNPLVMPTEPETSDSSYPEDDSELSIDLSRLAEELDSSLGVDSESYEGLGELNLGLDSEEASEPEDKTQPLKTSVPESRLDEPLMDELGIDLGETELHTELMDIDEATELDMGASHLDEELSDLSGDLEGVLADSQLSDNGINLEDNRLSDLTDAINPITQEVDANGDTDDQESFQGSDSEIGDEVETKLELARAFIEIGDADGARGILHEVEADGTPAQKQAAKELLDQLG